MRFDIFYGGSVLALVVTAVAVGFFGDGFSRKSAPTAASAKLAPGGPFAATAPVAAMPPMSSGQSPFASPPPLTNAAVMPAAVQQQQARPKTAQEASALANFIPVDIQLYEAHWQGMDTRLLDAELRQKLKYPRGLLGVLIGEVTLNAATAGLLAGDVIVSVKKTSVTTLEDFQHATRAVRNHKKAAISVLRKRNLKEDGRFIMKRLTLVLRGNPDLGFAQVEAAPMILPGDGRPHPYRGVCTNCHTVGRGFELSPDPDLITLPPPPLSHATVVKGISPHRDRGPCEACHVIIR